MRDILKKLMLIGLTYEGCKYVKYRINGGKPILEKAKEYKDRIREFVDKLDGKRPIELEANDFKIV